MENKSAKAPRISLDRDAWIKGAIAILAEHGVERLRVEVLATRLGVTKGSFYWHFKDRRDLQDAVLDLWKDGRIRDIRKQTQAQPGGEAAALLHTIEVYASARNRKGIAIEGAVRDWARRDPQAAAVVEEVDAERLACACRLFLACGIKQEEAQARSLLLYAYVFGVSLMRPGSFTSDIDSLKTWIAERIAR
jgi:AcrR family transcriptional regulator